MFQARLNKWKVGKNGKLEGWIAKPEGIGKPTETRRWQEDASFPAWRRELMG